MPFTRNKLTLIVHVPHLGVLRLLVPAQVDLPLERLVAQFAGKGLESGVLARVRYQI